MEQKAGIANDCIWHRFLLAFLLILLSSKDILAFPALLECVPNRQPIDKEYKSILNVKAVQCALRGQLQQGSTFVVWEHESHICKIYDKKSDLIFRKDTTTCLLMRCLQENKYDEGINYNTNCLPYQYEHGVLGEVYINVGAGELTTDLQKQEKYIKKQPDIVEVYEYFSTPWTSKYDTAAYELTALFKPPKTGMYHFGLHSDDGAELFFSFDEKVENLKIILSTPQNLRNKEPLMSKGMHLFKDHYYLLRGTLKEGFYEDYIFVGVKFEAEKYNRFFKELFYSKRWKNGNRKGF